jgi:hypothetical protein
MFATAAAMEPVWNVASMQPKRFWGHKKEGDDYGIFTKACRKTSRFLRLCDDMLFCVNDFFYLFQKPKSKSSN